MYVTINLPDDLRDPVAGLLASPPATFDGLLAALPPSARDAVLSATTDAMLRTLAPRRLRPDGGLAAMTEAAAGVMKCMLDEWLLPHGIRLGDATAAELRHYAKAHRTLAGDARTAARFYKTLAAIVPAGHTVRQSLDNAKVMHAYLAANRREPHQPKPAAARRAARKPVPLKEQVFKCQNRKPSPAHPWRCISSKSTAFATAT